MALWLLASFALCLACDWLAVKYYYACTAGWAMRAAVVYYLYGGRGITVDTAWQSFAQFLKDLGPRPTGHTLERLDNALSYSAANCRWATPREQANNRRPWGSCVAR